MGNLRVSEYDPQLVKSSLLPLYESVYKFEIERKDAINSRLSFPIAILTLLLGAMAYIIKGFPSFDNTGFCWALYVLSFLSAVSIICAIYFFIRSLFKYEYGYLRPLGMIDNVVRDLKRHNENVAADKQIDIENELSVFLIEQYCSSSDINRDLNKKKTGYFTKTLKALVISALFLFISFIPFLFLNKSTTAKAQNIKVQDFPLKAPIVIEIKKDGELKNFFQEATKYFENNKNTNIQDSPLKAPIVIEISKDDELKNFLKEATKYFESNKNTKKEGGAK